MPPPLFDDEPGYPSEPYFAAPPRRLQSYGGGRRRRRVFSSSGFDLLDADAQREAIDLGIVDPGAAPETVAREQRAERSALTEAGATDFLETTGRNRGSIRPEYGALFDAGTPEQAGVAFDAVAELRAQQEAKRAAKELRALAQQRSQLNSLQTYHKRALKAFDQANKGEIAFQKDGTDAGALAGQIADLETKAKERVGTIRGALTPGVSAGDPTDAARAAEAQLPQLRDRYKQLLEKRQRIAAESERVSGAWKAADDSYAAALAKIRGIPAGPSAPAADIPPPPERIERPADTISTRESVVDAATPTLSPDGIPTPASLIKMKRQADELQKTLDEAGANLAEPVRDRLTQQVTTLRQRFDEGFGQQPEHFQQRIANLTKDATLAQKIKGAAVNVATGAGTALVDTGEFVARNALRSIPGITSDGAAQKFVSDFSDAMRGEAESWNNFLPEKAREDVNSGFWTGDVARGAGSTLAFMAPTSMVAGVGRIAGLSQKAIASLVTASVAATGAASEGNSLRREAEARLLPELESGKITAEEFKRGLGAAEFFGTIIGTTEALPVSRFARRIGELPAGKTFLRSMLDAAGVGGAPGVKAFIRGPGRKMLVDVVSEGFEEAGQEFGQSVAEDLVAKNTFDPEREVGTGAVRSGAAGGISGALFSALTQAMGMPRTMRRYRDLGEAVNRGRDAGGDTTTGATAETNPPPPVPSAGPATVAPEMNGDTGGDILPDEELRAELDAQRASASGYTDRPNTNLFDDAGPDVVQNASQDIAPTAGVVQDAPRVDERPASDTENSDLAENAKRIPPPDWRVTVQAPQDGVPGYIQIDKINPATGDSEGSASPEDLAAEGYNLPAKLDELPTGQYSFGQLAEAAKPSASVPAVVPTERAPAGAEEPLPELPSAGTERNPPTATGENTRLPTAQPEAESPRPQTPAPTSSEAAQLSTEQPTNALPQPSAETLPLRNAPERRKGVRGENTVDEVPAGARPAEAPVQAQEPAAIQPEVTARVAPALVEASTQEPQVDTASPGAFVYVDVQPGEIPAGVRERVGEFEAVDNDSRRRRGEQPVTYKIRRLAPEAETAGSLQSPGGVEGQAAVRRMGVDQQRRLELAFDKRIVFVEPSVPVEWGAQASSAKGTTDTVLVNTKAEHPLLALTGHEFTHTMSGDRPSLYAPFEKSVLDLAPMPADYEATKRGQGYAQPAREWVADVVGQRFDEPEFWREVADRAKKSPQSRPALHALAEWAQNWLTRLATRVRNALTGHARADMLANIEKVRGVIADAFVEYSNRPSEDAIPSAADAELARPLNVEKSTPAPLSPPKNAEVPGQPGYRYRSHPDSLILAGIETARQVYKTRSNEGDDAAAKDIIKELGEPLAADIAMNPDADLPGAVKTAIAVNLQHRLNRRRFDTKISPEERQKAASMAARLAEAKAEQFTDMGQALQFLARLNRYSEDGVMMAATKAVRERQNRTLGEPGGKVADEATRVLNETNAKAIDEATSDLNRALRTVRVGKSIWKQYRDAAARRWLSRVESNLGTLEQSDPPLAIFTNALVAEVTKKIDAALPPGERRPGRKPIEVIGEAINNREKYKEAWDVARAEIEKKFAGQPEMLATLDEELIGVLDRPFSDKTLDRAIKEAHREMGVTVRDLARMHYRQADALGQSLADKLVAQAGVKPEDAARLADTIKQRVAKLTAEAKKKALARIASRAPTGGPGRKLATLADKLIALSNAGAFTRSDLLNAVAKDLKLPSLSEEQAQTLRDFAEKIQDAPEGFQRDRVVTDLLAELRKIRGVGPVDIATAVYYSHLLSGYTTQMVNGISTALNTLAEVANLIVRNPGQAGHVARGVLAGARTGFVQALSILDTGYAHAHFDEKLPEVSPILESVAKDKSHGAALRAYTSLLRYIGRAMKAMDSVFFHSASEAYQRVAAAKLAAAAEGPMSRAELNRKIRDLLSISPADFEAARAQAKSEGLTGLDYELRVAEITRQKRDPALSQAGTDFGREATFNNEPRGYLGVVARAVGDASARVPVIKLFVPFTNIVSNVTNASLNYSPLGVVRALKGYGGEEAPNAEERSALLVKGIGGSLGLLALLAYGFGDGDEPWITANGPSDASARNQLRETGWKPHTIKAGDAYVSYLETPFALPLALVGNYLDAIRYNKLSEKDAADKALIVAGGMGETLFNMSFLQGLGNLMDVLRGEPGAVKRFAQSAVAGATVPNAVRQVDRTFDPKIYESSGVTGTLFGSVPGIRQMQPERHNVVGKPIESQPLERFGRAAKNDPLWDTLAAKQAFIPEAGKQTKVGQRVMTPEEHRRYVEISGVAIERRLRAALPAIQRMTNEQADDFVQRISREERARAKPQALSRAAAAR